MNKIFYCIVIASLFSIFLSAQNREKTSIEIVSINFNTTSIMSTHCEDFVSQFTRGLMFNEVFAEDSIALLDSLLQKIKLCPKENATVNTRAKLMYRNKQGEEVTICVGKFNILVNGQLIKKNKLFSEFIFSLIPKENLQFPYPKPSK